MDETGRTPDLRVLSLGAGVQSSALLLLMCEGELPKPDVAIFADTQAEPQGVYDYLEYLTGFATAAGIDVVKVTSGSLEDDVLRFEKRPGRGTQPSIPAFVRQKAKVLGKEAPALGAPMRRFCTKDYKINPQTTQMRTMLGLQPGQRVPKGTLVQQVFGISTDEIVRMKDSRLPWIVNDYPLIDLGMSRQDCIDWIISHGYREPAKSACYFCPYHDDEAWQRLKVDEPAAFAQAVEFDHAIRSGVIRGADSEVFLHRTLQPLELVDFTATREEQLGQSSLLDGFGEECEGMCGV